MSEQDLAGLKARRAPTKVAATAAPATGKQRLQALGRKPPGQMNKSEARYAQRLELLKQSGEVLWYEFEAITLKLAHDTRLTVDFFVMLKTGELQAHDVKGSTARAVYQDDARAKMQFAARLFPWPFFLCVPRGRTGHEWDITEVKP